MAGDWIKMRVDLRDDPAVILIASALDVSEDEVVGKLHRLWCWADKHTTDGTAPAITDKWVDRYVGSSGFAAAMVSAKWISFSGEGVVFPSFERHNGESAKRRVEATLRKRLSRENRDNGETGSGRDIIPRPFVRYVMKRDAYQCVFCGEQSDEKREASRKAILSIDHLVPVSRGGTTTVDNLVCSCRQCNNEKNDRTPEEWGIEPSFLQPVVSYVDGKIVAPVSQEMCDKNETREEKIREDIKEPPNPPEGVEPKKKERKQRTLLKTFLDTCKTEGKKPVSSYRPLMEYVEKVSLPSEFLALAWDVFRKEHSDGGTNERRLQADWQKHFYNYVTKGYYRLWICKPDGSFELTTVGQQNKKFQEAA